MPSESNVFEWIVHLDGPATYMPANTDVERPSPYAGRRFTVKAIFPENYPFKEPSIMFREGVMWHPIVDFKTGIPCENAVKSFWGPTKMAIDLFQHLQSILAHPTGAGAVNADASQELLESLDKFETNARNAASKEPKC